MSGFLIGRMKSLAGRHSVAALARVAGVGVLTLLAGGCVSQQAFDDLVEENRTLTARNTELQARVGELEGQINGISGSASNARRTLSELESENGLLRQQLGQARDQIRDLEGRLGGIQLTSLDPTTDAALAALAAQYPGLVEYDASRGLLRFNSDLTFDSGSAEVKSTARESLRALAQILQSPTAQGYDVRIVGHTDSQRVANPRTKQQHPTNTHLSVHRSIAVRDELGGIGVGPERLEVAGWGEYRPRVANSPGGNTPANRRVEVYLVAGSSRGYDSSAPAPAAGSLIDRERVGGSAFEPTK